MLFLASMDDILGSCVNKWCMAPGTHHSKNKMREPAATRIHYTSLLTRFANHRVSARISEIQGWATEHRMYCNASPMPRH